MFSQSVGQLVSWSVGQLVSGLVSQSVDYSAGGLVGQSVSRSFIWTGKKTIIIFMQAVNNFDNLTNISSRQVHKSSEYRDDFQLHYLPLFLDIEF